MGFLSHILLGDLGQSLDIEETRSAVKDQAMRHADNSAKLRNAGMEIDRLKQQNRQLHLAVTALSRFLVERGVVDAVELEAYIRKIDEDDGQVDGGLAFAEAPKPPAR